MASQANKSDGNGNSMAEFAVVAKIPHVTAQQAKRIDIGMSAKIDVPITTKPQIGLPIDAITIDHGETVVHVINSQGKT